MSLHPCLALLHCFLQVQSICRLVLRRSARLASSLLVAVLRLQDWLATPRRLVVAVDGGVFLKCTNWRKYLTHYLAEAFGKEQSVTAMQGVRCLGSWIWQQACDGHCSCQSDHAPFVTPPPLCVLLAVQALAHTSWCTCWTSSRWQTAPALAQRSWQLQLQAAEPAMCAAAPHHCRQGGTAARWQQWTGPQDDNC